MGNKKRFFFFFLKKQILKVLKIKLGPIDPAPFFASIRDLYFVMTISERLLRIGNFYP